MRLRSVTPSGEICETRALSATRHGGPTTEPAATLHPMCSACHRVKLAHGFVLVMVPAVEITGPTPAAAARSLARAGLLLCVLLSAHRSNSTGYPAVMTCGYS